MKTRKFLDYMSTKRGIKIIHNHEKCCIVLEMHNIRANLLTCESSFLHLIEAFVSPLVLTRLEPRETLHLYLLMIDKFLRPLSDKSWCTMLVKSSKEANFYWVTIHTDHLIQHILRFPKLVGHMVAWAIDLFTYKFVYNP
ncbi:hypothetical protein CR513_31505, partial [Mucuna pruriens]